MADAEITRICTACGFSGTGKFCSSCGQSFDTRRISIAGLLHDVFHFFTHLDKGFGYTARKLFTAPGTMQQAYVDGERSKHQKPFSMFFICATVLALGRYWIFSVLQKYYNVGQDSEVYFVHEYMVLFQLSLIPLHILITYLFFFKSRFNYAETGVMLLYAFSAFFLLATAISLLKFTFPHLDTAYIELPLMLVYNAITFVRFYNMHAKWLVVLKSIMIFLAIFLLIQVIEDNIIHVIESP